MGGGGVAEGDGVVTLLPASPAHVGTIATRMRDIDRLECAVFGRAPKQAVRLALMSSARAWTVKVDGRAEAMFGVTAVSALEGIGSPWLLMTDVAARQARALVVLGRRYTGEMKRMFPRLENMVHADNATAIRWLSRLGYAIEDAAMVNGHPMRGFSM